MIRAVYIMLFLMVLWSLAEAQDSVQVQVEKQLEQNFEELDEESGLTGEQLVQFLEDLAANPVNINSAGITDLLQVPGINIIIANAILSYRQQKPFENVEDLLDISGIGQVSYQRLKPYVTIGSTRDRFIQQFRRPEYWTNGRKIELISRFQQNIEQQDGYLRDDSLGGYLGNPAKYYQRLRWQSNHISVNLTQEKDAGEQLRGPADFDFNSWHLAIQNNGKLETLVLGDYSLSFGQGMVLWTGGSFGKGREVTGTVGKNERGVRPYGSAQETDFFRGGAFTYGGDLQITAFYSDRPRSASVINADTTRFPSTSGLNRTESERSRRNNINQQSFGSRLSWNSKVGMIGITGYRTQFSTFIQPGTRSADRYDFSGRTNSVIGADYRGLIGRSLVFGEFARSENGGFGAVGGLETIISSATELAILVRNYQKDFQSFLATGFGEKSGAPQNETGIYIGLKHQIDSRFTASAYFDQFRFQFSGTEVSEQTGGYDLLGMLEVKYNRNLNAYVLIRNEVKDTEFSQIADDGREYLQLGEKGRSSVRFQVEYQPNKLARLRSRVELARYKPVTGTKEYGMLLYQDMRVNPVKKLQIDGRISFFDTDSFDARVYQFENDLLYVLSNTALSGQGQRWYAVVKYEPFEYLQLGIKYSRTVYENVQALSSGLNQISGNTRSFIGVQLRLYIK